MLPGKITGSEEGLAAYWDFEKGPDANVLYDRSDNLNHGRIVGAKWCPSIEISLNTKELEIKEGKRDAKLKVDGSIDLPELAVSDGELVESRTTIEISGVLPDGGDLVISSEDTLEGAINALITWLRCDGAKTRKWKGKLTYGAGKVFVRNW